MSRLQLVAKEGVRGKLTPSPLFFLELPLHTSEQGNVIK